MPAIGLTEILDIINGVLQFPAQLLAVIRVLKQTPQEQHDKLIAQIQAEAQQFSQTGRPQP